MRQRYKEQELVNEPVIVWYKTRRYGTEIEPVDVVQSTDAMVWLKEPKWMEDGFVVSRKAMASEYAVFHKTKADAIRFLLLNATAARAAKLHAADELTKEIQTLEAMQS